MQSAIIDKYTNRISLLSAAKKVNITEPKLKLFIIRMFKSGLVTNIKGIVLTSSAVMDYFKNINMFDNILQKKYTQHF